MINMLGNGIVYRRTFKSSRESGGMLPRNIFENLHAVMAMLVLFEYFSGKLCLNFLTLILGASPNIIHFDRTFFVMHV